MKELELGAGKFKGYYTKDKKITFKVRPTQEWEYMATGTGRTGIAVLAHDHLILQLNHEGSVNEHGNLLPICRIHMQYIKDPFSVAEFQNRFSMVHDLKNSVIRVIGDVQDENIVIEIRACMQTDLIRIDITDNRLNPEDLKLWVEVPWAGFTEASTPGKFTMWHNNGKITEWHEINLASGIKDDSSFADILRDRCFGFSIKTEDSEEWIGNHTILKGKKENSFYIAAIAAPSEEEFLINITKSFNCTKSKDDFIAQHNNYWSKFWSKAWFETDEVTMLPFMAAYDLYRYFCAVSSGKDREFPLRFQIDLLRSTFRSNSWATMQIHSVQTIQAYYGAFKNGDWCCLESLLSDYERKLPIYKKLCSDFFEHEGVIIPYETNLWGSLHYDKAVGPWDKHSRRFKDKNIYHLATHKWSMYSFEHGLAIIQFFLKIAQSKADQSIIKKIILPYSLELCSFFINHYMQDNGMLVFDPATSGETWYDVRNPSSWICLFKAVLPEIIDIAKAYENNELESLADKLLKGLPEIPKDSRSGEEVILPAEVFDRHPSINRETPELYGIWPYSLYGIGLPDYDLALRTFNKRIWRNINTGWSLDMIWAACLGLTDAIIDEYVALHFKNTIRCPGGFSYEEAPVVPEENVLPLYPSMQGMGTSVCHIYEMVCQDRGNHIIVLPAWPSDKPVKIALYSSVAGRVEISYQPEEYLKLKLERDVEIKLADESMNKILIILSKNQEIHNI